MDEIAANLVAPTGFAWGTQLETEKRLVSVTINDLVHRIETSCTITIILREVTDEADYEESPVFFPYYSAKEYLYLDVTANNGQIEVSSDQLAATELKNFDVKFVRVLGSDGDITVAISLVSHCPAEHTITIDGAQTTTATWAHADVTPQTKAVSMPNEVADCSIDILIDGVVGQVIWLSGELGSHLITTTDPSNNGDISKAYLINADSVSNGQRMKLTRYSFQAI